MPQAKKFTTSPKIPMNKLLSDELFGSTYGMLWVANYSQCLCNTQSVNILTVIRVKAYNIRITLLFMVVVKIYYGHVRAGDLGLQLETTSRK